MRRVWGNRLSGSGVLATRREKSLVSDGRKLQSRECPQETVRRAALVRDGLHRGRFTETVLPLERVVVEGDSVRKPNSRNYRGCFHRPQFDETRICSGLSNFGAFVSSPKRFGECCRRAFSADSILLAFWLTYSAIAGLGMGAYPARTSPRIYGFSDLAGMGTGIDSEPSSIFALAGSAGNA